MRGMEMEDEDALIICWLFMMAVLGIIFLQAGRSPWDVTWPEDILTWLTVGICLFVFFIMFPLIWLIAKYMRQKKWH